MIGSTEGVRVTVLGPWSEDHIEVIAGESLQPPEDHSLRFFHGFDPFQSSMVSPEGEFPLGQVVPALAHEVDRGEDLSLVGGVVRLSRVELLSPV